MTVRKIIVAGSRGSIVSYDRIYTWIDWLFHSFWDQYDWDYDEVEIVSGGEKSGVDACGEAFSRDCLKREPKVFPADWKKHGKAAGPLRNRQMAEYADAALIFIARDAPTPGSSNMYTWMGLFEKPAKVLWV